MSVSEKLLFQKTMLPLLQNGLSAYSLRQKAIANNIANLETEGYQRRVVSFEEQLAEAIDSNGGEPGQVEGVLEIDKSADYFNGVNNVDVDLEMTDLARAQLNYRFATRQVRHGFEQLKLAIRGTR